MSRFFALPLIALAGATFAAGSPALPQRDVWVTAQVTIDAQGHLAAVDWKDAGDDKLAALVATHLDPIVKAWDYAPGSIDGVPAETRTVLTVQVNAAAQADGSASLHVAYARTGPAGLAIVVPGFPAAALRDNLDAHVTYEMDIDADGRATVTDIQVDSRGNKRAFIDAMRKAVAASLYQPEVVGGRAVPTHAVSYANFCVSGRAQCLEWSGNASADQRASPGQPDADSVASIKTTVAGIEI